ncbi:hypothetical protein Lal_00047882 [Lupinus albus]|uniref:Putative gibberellin regulated protein n=1 Tax=Lupinus albus TaxID=3870 RepID=A0A6A5N269_LUPAL|nr:putative gibberellin regulated protein [Lupinus albus]KAF1879209.1 hypothetical protein Lal_00047882 [Lupinus albus]
MAFTKCTLILAILCFIFIHELEINGGNQPIMAAAIECGEKCNFRCSKSSDKDCLTNCIFCCGKCNCVPSGTSGNRQECPCYDTWPNYLGDPLCP